MRGLDVGRTRQRGDRARDARDADPPAARERQALDRVRQQLRGRLGAPRQRAVAKRPRAATTRARTGADASPGGAASSAARGRGMATARSKRSSRARESFSRYAASRCGAARGTRRPDRRARRTGTCSSFPRAGSGRGRAQAADARDGDDTVLERLPQRLEHRARELGQLVEQQDAAMRKRDLARARAWAATDDGRRRRAVVRCPKRRRP